MRYRKKETCKKLCGKTLLLLPHLKRFHGLLSREQYDEMASEIKTKTVVSESKSNISTVTTQSYSDEGDHLASQKSGLHKLMESLGTKTPLTARPVKQKVNNEEKTLETLLVSLDELIRYFVHNMCSYQVIAMGLAVEKQGTQEKSSIASYLHGTCMSDIIIENCDCLDMLLSTA